jgi:hypothetical protein
VHTSSIGAAGRSHIGATAELQIRSADLLCHADRPIG